MNFREKVVVITGGAKGIGRATARLFSHEGARVVIVDTDVTGGQETEDCIKKEGGVALFVKTDVSNSDDVAKMVQLVDESFGRVDVLFNNAGIYARGNIVETSEVLWDKIVGVNLGGIYHCSRKVIPIMKRNGGGCIVNTSSSVGLFGAAKGIAAYAASKGGVTLLTRAMAIDHLDDHIRVNCICPGPTDTPLLRASRTNEDLQAFMESLPSRHLIDPTQIARTVLYLASDESSIITGVALPVDMGQTARL